MPNWVHNRLSVAGGSEHLVRFEQQAGMPHTETWKEGSVLVDQDLSFWNFKRPEDTEAYFGDNGIGSNWYRWNVDNWGTKWDACNVEKIYHGVTSLEYTFDTAWSPPLPVLQAMVEQFPDLTFEMRSVEEQGWGVVYWGENGTLEEIEGWDIPETHTEWVKSDQEHRCPCQWSNSWSDWYDDCPRRGNPLTVEEADILEDIIESF